MAPTAFHVLPARALAGEFVGKILTVVFLSGLVVGLLAAALEARGPRSRRWVLRVIAAASMVVSCGIAQFGIAPRISRIREEAVVPIDSLAADHMLRIEFGRLHGMSVAWMAVALLAALSLVLLAWLGLGRADAAEGSAAEPGSGSGSGSENYE